VASVAGGAPVGAIFVPVGGAVGAGS
jgi:hypothetical protein